MAKEIQVDRRGLLRSALRITGGIGLAALAAALLSRGKQLFADDDALWQIDPNKCIQCGNCATKCVLNTSAVKCVHGFALCGYCDLCTGYFEAQPNQLDSAAENQLCPTGAIKRSFVEDPYYEYIVDEPLCVGCGKCVKGCAAFGNGSLFLQVRHDRCLNCNQCRIAQECPAQALVRVPSSKPYLLKEGGGHGK